MALWTVRIGEETRDGLTIYQLQELIRSGQVSADAEASQGADWKRVADIPTLARSLPETAAQSPAPGAKTINILGVELELDENGKPRPLPPEVIAQMLASQSSRTTDPDRAKRWNRGALLGASVLVIVLMLFLIRMLLAGGAEAP